MAGRYHRYLAVPTAALALLAGCDVRRGDLPAEPPKGWADLGRHPAYGELRLATVEEVDAYCKARGADREAFNKRRVTACVDHDGKLVVLPAKGTFDPAKEAALEAHENSHSWGTTHQNGKRAIVWPDGSPLRPLTPAQVQTMRALAEAQNRNVFAQSPAAGGNVFGGR